MSRDKLSSERSSSEGETYILKNVFVYLGQTEDKVWELQESILFKMFSALQKKL